MVGKENVEIDAVCRGVRLMMETANVILILHGLANFG
jgi:hypothetical protein